MTAGDKTVEEPSIPALPAFLKQVHRCPTVVVERSEGERTVSWWIGSPTIRLNGDWTADELRQMVEMMEKANV